MVYRQPGRYIHAEDCATKDARKYSKAYSERIHGSLIGETAFSNCNGGFHSEGDRAFGDELEHPAME
jgi:hypothetical protein